LEHLQLGLNIYLVTNKHKAQMKDMMENKVELSRNLFTTRIHGFLTWITNQKQPKSDKCSTWLIVILDKLYWTHPFWVGHQHPVFLNGSFWLIVQNLGSIFLVINFYLFA
jgi:hypothetical protein